MTQNKENNQSDHHGTGSVTQSVLDKPLWEIVSERTIKRYQSKDKQPLLSNPYTGGIMIGVLLFAAILISGNGLGESGGFKRIIAAIMYFIAPAHTETLPVLKQYLVSSSHPLQNWYIYMMIGIFAGGAFSGWKNRRLTREVLHGPSTTKTRRLIFAFIGGSIVAIGGSLAGGCLASLTISDASMLGVAGWLFFLPVFIAGMAVAYLMKKEWL